MKGRLRSVEICPRDSVATLEAELFDGTGALRLVWLGRREIPGVHPGRRLRVSGTVSREGTTAVLYNPRYELLPDDEA